MPKGKRSAEAEMHDPRVVAAMQRSSASGSGVITLVYFAVAVLVSALPVYLFTKPMFGEDKEPLKLDGEDNNLNTVLSVTGVSTLALVVAYTSYGNKQKALIARTRRAPDGKIMEVPDIEPAAYSLFFNNAAFLVLFLACTFYVLPRFDLDTEKLYSAAVAGAAVVCAVGAYYRVW